MNLSYFDWSFILNSDRSLAYTTIISIKTTQIYKFSRLLLQLLMLIFCQTTLHYIISIITFKITVTNNAFHIIIYFTNFLLIKSLVLGQHLLLNFKFESRPINHYEILRFICVKKIFQFIWLIYDYPINYYKII